MRHEPLSVIVISLLAVVGLAIVLFLLHRARRRKRNRWRRYYKQ